jgi:hypothetical protein
MVDFILWKNAGHVKPSKNVRVYNSPINADLYISSFTDPRSVQENRGRAWLPL